MPTKPADARLPWRESPPLAPAGPHPTNPIVAQMANLLTSQRPASDAEALRLLRGAFAEFPLTLRLAAIAWQARKPSLQPAQAYMPR
jgi:hypothetical protein